MIHQIIPAFFQKETVLISILSASVTGLNKRQGVPAATTPDGISLVTTLPAPIIDPFLMVSPPHITAFAPIHTSSSKVIGADVVITSALCWASMA